MSNRVKYVLGEFVRISRVLKKTYPDENTVVWVADDTTPPVCGMVIGMRRVFDGCWKSGTDAVYDYVPYFEQEKTHSCVLFVTDLHRSPKYAPIDAVERVDGVPLRERE